MNNSIQLLKVFHTGFIVCLVMAAIFLVISILLFIKFDIKGIWELKSGRARAKAIKEKEEEAALSGKFRKTGKHAPELYKSGELIQDKQAKDDAMPPGTVPRPVVISASERLREGTNMTTSLSPEDRKAQAGRFAIEKQIVFVHTEEMI